MRNASRAFGFLTRNSSLGAMYFKYLEVLENVRQRNSKYAADLILLIKFKKIIGL